MGLAVEIWHWARVCNFLQFQFAADDSVSVEDYVRFVWEVRDLIAIDRGRT